MKMLITGLLVLAASVLTALAFKQNNGYVLIGYDRWTVEGSLVLFLLIILALFITLYLVLRLLIRIWHSPGKMRDWQGRRGAHRASKALTLGLVELSEGHWKRAEKSLIRHVRQSETPLLNYLAAARAAQQQGADQRRDQYLHLAQKSMPSADLAVGLTQAELQLEHQQMERALTTLKRLQGSAPRNRQVLKLQKELYEKSGAWEELQRLLPELRKQKLAGQGELQQLELRVFRNLLDRAALSGDPDRLAATWKGFPSSGKAAEALIICYANHLMDRGAVGQVEALLRSAVSRNWSESLVELYGRLETEDSAKQLASAEVWLKPYPRNPVLLLTLGRLSVRGRLWGKARSYLEASIGAGPTPQAYQELGVLLEGMEEREQALVCFRSGLELSNEVAPSGSPHTLGSTAPNDHRSLPAGPVEQIQPKLAAVPEGK